MNDIPFDLRHLRAILYLNNGKGLAALQTAIRDRDYAAQSLTAAHAGWRSRRTFSARAITSSYFLCVQPRSTFIGM